MSLKMEQIKSKNNVVTCSECNSKELLVASKVKAFASSGLIMFIISSVCIWTVSYTHLDVYKRQIWISF